MNEKGGKKNMLYAVQHNEQQYWIIL